MADGGGASRTAEFMALFRALESARPRGRRLFDDPLARAFLSTGFRPLPALARLRPAGWAIEAFMDRRWPGARASGVARTRVIDDHLRRALADGMRQVVVVGAGFDARAYRIEGVESATVFEIDREQTQTPKRATVASRLGREPAHVRFVTADLERIGLDDALRAAGFDAGAAAFVIWEGVTNYLSAEAVDATLRAVVSVGGRGSRLAFTYV